MRKGHIICTNIKFEYDWQHLCITGNTRECAWNGLQTYCDRNNVNSPTKTSQQVSLNSDGLPCSKLRQISSFLTNLVLSMLMHTLFSTKPTPFLYCRLIGNKLFLIVEKVRINNNNVHAQKLHAGPEMRKKLNIWQVVQFSVLYWKNLDYD